MVVCVRIEKRLLTGSQTFMMMMTKVDSFIFLERCILLQTLPTPYGGSKALVLQTLLGHCLRKLRDEPCLFQPCGALTWRCEGGRWEAGRRVSCQGLASRHCTWGGSLGPHHKMGPAGVPNNATAIGRHAAVQWRRKVQIQDVFVCLSSLFFPGTASCPTDCSIRIFAFNTAKQTSWRCSVPTRCWSPEKRMGGDHPH